VCNIVRSLPPHDGLLSADSSMSSARWKKYQDCFRVCLSRNVTLEQFVFAFYTSWLFKVERGLLRLFLRISSSDSDAVALTQGTRSTFAAWYVGMRTPTELLMCDRYEQTRSWFRVEPLPEGGSELYFGTAVAGRSRGGVLSMSPMFRALLGFHVIYSRLLLHAARRSLLRHNGT